MNPSPDSRFTIDELNQVISNWESIVKEYAGKFKLRKQTYTDRGIILQQLNIRSKDVNAQSTYFIESKLPYRGKLINVKTSEVKAPIFQYTIIPNINFSFSIRDEDYMDKISKWFGAKELQIGDRNFDRNNFLETNRPDLLQEFLDNDIRKWLGKLRFAYFDYNTIKSEKQLSIYLIINELDKHEIKKHISMFEYCIDKLNKLLN